MKLRNKSNIDEINSNVFLNKLMQMFKIIPYILKKFAVLPHIMTTLYQKKKSYTPINMFAFISLTSSK